MQLGFLALNLRVELLKAWILQLQPDATKMAAEAALDRPLGYTHWRRS
jgi:hypothetical protein